MIKTFTDIAEEIRELQAQLESHAEEHDGDITDFPLLQHLEDLQKAQEGKAAHEHMLCSLACMSLEYNDEAEAMRTQAKRIIEAAAKVEAKAEGIRKFIAGQLPPGEKIKDDRVTLSTRKSTAIEIDALTSPTDLPLEYQRVTVAADRTALKKSHGEGRGIYRRDPGYPVQPPDQIMPCKPQKLEYMKKYYQEHSEARKAYAAKYSKEHREAMRAYWRAWAERNKEKRRVQRKGQRLAQREMKAKAKAVAEKLLAKAAELARGI